MFSSRRKNSYLRWKTDPSPRSFPEEGTANVKQYSIERRVPRNKKTGRSTIKRFAARYSICVQTLSNSPARADDTPGSQGTVRPVVQPLLGDGAGIQPCRGRKRRETEH